MYNDLTFGIEELKQVTGEDYDDIMEEFEGVSVEERNNKPVIKLKHPGEFSKWCHDQGHKEVNCACICEGLKSDDPHRVKQANFAYNFGFKRNGKTCKCVEELRAKKKKS